MARQLAGDLRAEELAACRGTTVTVCGRPIPLKELSGPTKRSVLWAELVVEEIGGEGGWVAVSKVIRATDFDLILSDGTRAFVKCKPRTVRGAFAVAALAGGALLLILGAALLVMWASGR